MAPPKRHTYSTYDSRTSDREQLIGDLDALLSELDAGWEPLGAVPGRKHRVGIGGCLLTAMNRSLTANCIPHSISRDQRMYDMVGAMGFLVGLNGTGFPENAISLGAMYLWNDAQTDVDVVKARVKDAINNL